MQLLERLNGRAEAKRRGMCLLALNTLLLTCAGVSLLAAITRERHTRGARVYAADDGHQPNVDSVVRSCTEWLALAATLRDGVVLLEHGSDTPDTAHCASAECVACVREYGIASAPPAAYRYVRAPSRVTLRGAAQPFKFWLHMAELAARNDSLCHSCHMVERLQHWAFTGNWSSSPSSLEDH
jgi:hypothetical protein